MKGSEGELGLYPGHSQLLTQVAPGPMRIQGGVRLNDSSSKSNPNESDIKNDGDDELLKLIKKNVKSNINSYDVHTSRLLWGDMNDHAIIQRDVL